ncbi:OLC1v1012691C1 [Oldenlandia corymbosa var. corymbosa]|uniref:OLC1v1012691C1 n=1 Tax=Oldenlandia corymbosa var. corymbosa TaxID=529605 RepID=A0AAV1DWK3_OLDCO|nr:OLC1v1012691C1 [Oldenlandia corymbosa var. corymbosa]
MNSTVQDSGISPEFRQENNIPGIDSVAALPFLPPLRLNYASINCGDHQLTTMAQCTPRRVSNKRQSPSDFSPEQPSSKRAATAQQPSSSAGGSSGGQLLQNGFTKIPLSSTGLGRTLSAPIPTKNLYDQFSEGALTNSLIHNPSPEKSSGVNSVPVHLPPSQQPQRPLYRTYSEPIPAAYQSVATSASPRPPAAGHGIQESPDAKRFRRMKDRLREMSKWWNEVIKEGEEEDESGSDNDDHHCPPKDECEANQGTEASENEEASHHDQEAVWVERKGELLILHFKCPCSKSYQILLSENNCYYKLSSF